MASFSANTSSLTIEFQEGDMDKYLQQLQPEWMKFYLPAEGPLIILMVQEFYLALKQREATRPFYKMYSFVNVRRVNVLVTKMTICQIYDAPYYYYDYLYKIDFKEFRNIGTEEVLRFLTVRKETWAYQMGIVIPEMFNQELMTPKAKMWMKFGRMRPKKELKYFVSVKETIRRHFRLVLVTISQCGRSDGST
ncbi:hypothetical protein Gotri_003994 [Gossypium trilobum]|uniref:Uncharacterized protein n=1 Tax=Gossypium trilobum TaxID=34281 RepID=A0A7J9F3P9_9ROSI|nr:hypothetical protein [Gossypium trilobum]